MNLNASFKRLTAHISIYYLSSLISVCVLMIQTFFLTHFLSLPSFGFLSVLKTLNYLIIILSGLFVGTAGHRFYYDTDDSAARLKILKNIFMINTVAGVSIILFCFTFRGMLSEILLERISGMINESESSEKFLTMLLAGSFFGILQQNILIVFSIIKKPVLYSFISITQNVLMTFLIWLLISKFSFGISGYLGAMILSGFISFLIAMVFIHPHLTGKFDVLKIKEMLIYNSPQTPITLYNWSFTGIGVLFLSNYSTPYQLALYGILGQIGYAFMRIPIAFNLAWVPHSFSMAKAEGHKRVVGNMYGVYITVLAAFAGGMVLFSKPALTILTPGSYYSVYSLTGIYLISYVFRFGSRIFQTGLEIEKKVLTVSIAYLGGITANLLFTFTLGFRYGFLGCIVSMVISSAVLNGSLYCYSSRIFKVDFQWYQGTLRAVAALIIPTAGILLMQSGNLISWLMIAVSFSAINTWICWRFLLNENAKKVFINIVKDAAGKFY